MKRILLIEDEDLVSKTLNKLLTKNGYAVKVCSSGAEAINIISNELFDLIISDIRMPDKNGVETIKEIREILKERDLNAIPEILISGFADQQTMKNAESLGAMDFFYKPFDLQSFLTSVRRNLK